MERVVLENAFFRAEIDPIGAELRSLIPAGGSNVIWGADPVFWPRTAPILFPIVGRLEGDHYTHAGQSFQLGQHGFARDSVFEVEQQDSDAVTLLLRASSETLARYPFAFELRVRYRLNSEGIETAFLVRNAGDETMPFGVGGHPAFNWPLEDGLAKTDYVLLFEQPEQGERYLVGDGLLEGGQGAVPWQGHLLPLDEALFREDAIVLFHPASQWVSFQPRQGGLSIRVIYTGFPFLGIWSKPQGAPFLCIEPWQGHASFAGESQALMAKRDMIHLPAGESFGCAFRIEVQAAAVVGS